MPGSQPSPLPKQVEDLSIQEVYVLIQSLLDGDQHVPKYLHKHLKLKQSELEKETELYRQMADRLELMNPFVGSTTPVVPADDDSLSSLSSPSPTEDLDAPLEADSELLESKITRDDMHLLRKLPLNIPGENYRMDGYPSSHMALKLLEEHANMTFKRVRTRFAPEPNEILHIGHAKSININFGYAKVYGGYSFLRYDDTNPEKEDDRVFKSIHEMVNWLGYKPYKVTHASEYFDQLYAWALVLINKGLAYVCQQKEDEFESPSPWRERPVAENYQRFQDMKNGKFAEGEATLRMKITLEEGQQDPVAYRIKFVPHPKAGDKWCVYPTYDFTHCLCDSIEDISHSLCTKEFQNRRSSYYWLCEAVDTYIPVQWEYGRLNVNYTVVSKRKIAKLIEEKIVHDWDDPRLFTLPALRRRGFPPEAVNDFCIRMGITGEQITVDPGMLEACVRDFLNINAPRTMVVIHPLRVVIENFTSEHPTFFEVPDFPVNPSTSPTHQIAFDKVIYIEHEDFKEEFSNESIQFAVDQPVGLRYVNLVLICTEVVKDENGIIKELRVNCANVWDVPFPKLFIHWVAKPINVEVRHYERLFKHKNPEDKAEVPGGFLSDCNSDSLKIQKAYGDADLSNAQIFTQYQFERLGYYSVDPDSKSSELVFNCTVSLKEDPGKN